MFVSITTSYPVDPYRCNIFRNTIIVLHGDAIIQIDIDEKSMRELTRKATESYSDVRTRAPCSRVLYVLLGDGAR